jgi:FMN phosphatase YigB (HAD superfamily)
MFKKTVIISLFLIVFFPSLFAQISSHKSMAALAEYIAQATHAPEDMLVIFDIDNTLAHPKTEIGSDQWLEHLAKEHAVNGKTIAQAFEELLPLYYQIQQIIDLQLTEDMIPGLIADLHNAGIRVIGLTARYHPIIDRTISQLAPLGLQFSSLSDEMLTIQARLKPAFYKNGIAFCSSNNKGEVLFELLKMLDIKPKKIFFVDDKPHHLARVEKIALEHGVDCCCIHYTGCQERVENFDAALAAKELAELQDRL